MLTYSIDSILTQMERDIAQERTPEELRARLRELRSMIESQSPPLHPQQLNIPDNLTARGTTSSGYKLLVLSAVLLTVLLLTYMVLSALGLQPDFGPLVALAGTILPAVAAFYANSENSKKRSIANAIGNLQKKITYQPNRT